MKKKLIINKQKELKKKQNMKKLKKVLFIIQKIKETMLIYNNNQIFFKYQLKLMFNQQHKYLINMDINMVHQH